MRNESARSAQKYPVYVRKVPRTWWLRTGPYRRFAAREFTAVFAAAFSIIMLLFLYALSSGPDDFAGFLRWLAIPGVVVLSAVILLATVYHAVTWFRLTSQILVVRLGRRIVPRRAVVVALLAAWVAVSGAVAYLHIWF
ncbi:MAG: fumarate reductase subunit C [Actinomycetota bacterium]